MNRSLRTLPREHRGAWLASGLLTLALLLPGIGAASAEPEKSTLVDAAWSAYERGDYGAALAGFKLLAADGVVKAQTNLGFMYAAGQGTSVDLVESAHWFRVAAEHGHPGAQATLGLYYFNGEGVARDVVAAHAWFALAASGGHALSPDYQRLAAEQMSVAELDHAHELAKKLYARFGQKKNLW